MRKRTPVLIIILLVLILSIMSFRDYVYKTESDPVIKERSTIITPPLDNSDYIIARKKNAIESEYPELKEFESQKSFAGQSIKIEVDGIDHYFAYIVHGSGLPIVQATCFRVDRMYRVLESSILGI